MKVKACGYYRLSREDGDKAESDSIKNQRTLVREYSKRNDLKLVDEYIDDGYTGTNFNRPSFMRLMEDIRSGRIDCIIIKDLSRLGRNYIEMGRMISNILPSLGARLIAINDNYDSNDDENMANQIIVPFKNLINDAYCRDMSLKVRSQLDMKRRMGKFIGSFALYGYMKDPKDHNHLVIDETAASIVELIFNMKMDGFSSGRIVRKLAEMQIPTPMNYKRICGMNYNSGFRSGTNPTWSVSTIDRILKNEMYTGTMIQGKRRKINYKIKQITDMDPSDWYKVEGMHDAIVPKSVFDCVQRLILMDTRTPPVSDTVPVFSGLLKCADCGQNMVRRAVTKYGRKYYYYHCSTNKNGGDCSSHHISEKSLMDCVLKAIRTNLEFLSNSVEIIRSMKERPHDVIGVNLLNKQIEEHVKEIEKYNSLKVKLYLDYQEGLITKAEYIDINDSFTLKLDRLKAALDVYQSKRKDKLSLNINDIPWIEEFIEYKNIQNIERRIAISLIEKISIHDGSHIEITFRHQEELEEILKIAMSAQEVIA